MVLGSGVPCEETTRCRRIHQPEGILLNSGGYFRRETIFLLFFNVNRGAQVKNSTSAIGGWSPVSGGRLHFSRALTSHFRGGTKRPVTSLPRRLHGTAVAKTNMARPAGVPSSAHKRACPGLPAKHVYSYALLGACTTLAHPPPPKLSNHGTLTGDRILSHFLREKKIHTFVSRR